MRVKAPGKLILSGEHAVVYGYPALAMAVNRHVELDLSEQNIPMISFHFVGINYQRDLSIAALKELYQRVNNSYQQYQQGLLKVQQILKEPVELLQFTLGLLLEQLEINLNTGLKFHIQSSVPLGCGMGSSASMILSVLVAVANYLHLSVEEDHYYQLGLIAENIQHGKSSGIDLQTALLGGCIFREQHKITSRQSPTVPMYLVHSGKPVSTTGECVSQVAPLFKNSRIGEDFAAVTLAMSACGDNLSEFKQAIKTNHALLKKINVVPDKVTAFIKQVEESGGAAKICGAGAILGEQAGMILAVTEDEKSLSSLSEKYGYQLMPIACETRGVHVI